MRWSIFLALMFVASLAGAAEGHVYKVLPQFLDDQGRDALTPSLYDRDAYQAYLRRNPDKRTALRFEVEWNAHVTQTNQCKLKVELRGVLEGQRPKEAAIELALPPHHGFSRWDAVILGGANYKTFGDVTAWRVTLWDGDKLLDEQKSFLW